MVDSWRPSADIENLQRRADCYKTIREFFETRQVLEVEVPCLGRSTVTDVNLEPIICTANRAPAYLQTSPEYFMKRLLAHGSGPIYYLGKAFRDGESGRRHKPEFTLLEWYRPGFDDEALIAEATELLTGLLPDHLVRQVSYQQLFTDTFGINPHRAEASELAELAHSHCSVGFAEADRSTWLDLLFSHVLEPTLAGLVVVYDFPACQAALARVATSREGERVAKRFECYADGLELGNGYWELADADELEARFRADQASRQAQGKAVPAIDAAFIAAHCAGLPDCAGIAVGVDRVLMARLGVAQIDQVIAFGVE